MPKGVRNLMVNITCARRVQTTNKRRPYHAVLSHLVLLTREKDDGLGVFYCDSYTWDTMSIVFPIKRGSNAAMCRIQLTFVSSCDGELYSTVI